MENQISEELKIMPRGPISRSVRKGRNLIAVASGKGGVGKTWFSITLAQALSLMRQKTLLFDADFGLANIDIQLGLMTKYDLGSVVSGGLDLLKTDKTYHIENPLISFTMKGTILREIEKVALDYTSDDTVKWKVNLASDLIEINFNGQEITI